MYTDSYCGSIVFSLNFRSFAMVRIYPVTAELKCSKSDIYTRGSKGAFLMPGGGNSFQIGLVAPGASCTGTGMAHLGIPGENRVYFFHLGYAQ
jgi:hypothetical protein